MSKLAELIAQREALDTQIAEIRNQEVAKAVATIHELINKFGLTSKDIFSSKSKKMSSGKVAAKYSDPQSGKTWTGRGKAPKWIDGKDRDAFIIK